MMTKMIMGKYVKLLRCIGIEWCFSQDLYNRSDIQKTLKNVAKCLARNVLISVQMLL